MRRLLIMVDKPAFIDALPVLRVEFAFRVGFHRGMVLLPADEAFHKSRFLVYQFCGVLFFGCHRLVSGIQAEIFVDRRPSCRG
jgi:hypothetical protein